MVQMVDIYSIKLVFIELNSVLKYTQGEIGTILISTNLQFVYQNEDLPQISLVFVMITRELLINLLWNLPQITWVSITQIKLSHIVTKLRKLSGLTYLLCFFFPGVEKCKEIKFIRQNFAHLFKSNYIMFGACIRAFELVNQLDNWKKSTN